MFQLNRFHIAASFVFLAALRIAIGFHFFDQGHQKFRKGGFDATGFFKAAEGPFAPLFHSLVPDYDGKIRLCYDPLKDGINKIDPEKTLKIWKAYKNYIVDELIREEKRLVQRRDETRARLSRLDPSSEEYLVLEKLYQRDEDAILAIRKSRAAGQANRIYESYRSKLLDFFAENEEEINYFFLGEDRLDGFERDYASTRVDGGLGSEDAIRETHMKKTARNVNRLREQIETIESERNSKAAQWLATVDDLWEGFEYELLNMVPLDDARQSELALATPSRSETTAWINRVVPWFDMSVGVLLIVGLFTRVASLAAGCFLVSILMTQPAILGEYANPNAILYTIEMLAAFTVFATCAGRYAGLDYFLHAGLKRLFKSESEEFI